MSDKTVQGSLAWHEHRAKHCNASEAPAVMDAGRFQPKNRTELTKVRNGSLVIERTGFVAAAQQAGLDNEARALSDLTTVVRQQKSDAPEFKPSVLEAEIDGLPMSASLDGVSGPNWVEVKTVTSEKSKYWTEAIAGRIEESALWQMTHQFIVAREHGIVHGSLMVCLGDHRLLIPYIHDEKREEELLKNWASVWPHLKAGTVFGYRDDAAWLDAVGAYMEAKRLADAAEARLKETKDVLVALADGNRAEGGGVSVDEIEREGGYDYSKLPEEILKTLPKKKGSKYWTVKFTKEN